MARLASKSAYVQLFDRLNRFPPGAPPTDLLFKILALLFSEREAALVSQLPVKPFTAKKAAAIWQIDEAEARNVLEDLASRAILLDMPTRNGAMLYVLPPMAGFFEFSMMRVRGDIDQNLLSELFYEYITVEEDFMRALLLDGETPPGRVFVNESALEQTSSILLGTAPLRGDGVSGTAREAESQNGLSDTSLQVLDYERASEVIRTAKHMGISLCYCRHKKQHIERACDKPLDICMTLLCTWRRPPQRGPVTATFQA